MYKNNKPIILNCFSRGGSNILWNLFLSHPDVCHPLEETLQIFNISLKSPRIAGYKIALMTKQNLFNQWNFNNRKSVNKKSATYIDILLHKKKMGNLLNDEMKYKNEKDIYTSNEIENTRLVIKNNNGLIFCSELFYDIYPSATFIAIIRNPLALYESHKRRKTPVSISINSFASFYRRMIQKIKNDQMCFPNYHIIKFEDILKKPISSVEKLYKWTNLDFSNIEKIRLKAKPSMRRSGKHTTPFTKNKHYWFSFSELEDVMNKDVNKNQITRLSFKEISSLSKALDPIMLEYNYSIE